MSTTPDDSTISYNYSACEQVYEQLTQDQATIVEQIASLEYTIGRLMSTWTGISASQWQHIQGQWMTATSNMKNDLGKAANCLTEMTSNMKYADRSAAARIADIGNTGRP